MYKKILVALSLLLLSCQPPATPSVESEQERPIVRSITQAGMDRYFFTSKQYQKKRVIIDLVLYNNYDEIAVEAAKHGLVVGEDEYIVAFSLDTLKGNRCEIHMLDPAIAYRPEFAGHEMHHCFFGQFHGSNSTKG